MKFSELAAELEERKNDPKVWHIPFKGDINTLAGAYDFLYNHPRAYDRADKKHWKKLSLRDRYMESHGQFIHHLSFYVTDKGVMLETGPIYYEDQFPDMYEGWLTNMHDYRLDVIAPTFEKALIKLAKKVKKYYGSY